MTFILGAVCAGICFGSIHLLNALKPGISLGSAASQACGAAGAGIFFCAVYFRTGKCLWYSILVHALHDAMIFVVSGRLSGLGTNAVINDMGLENTVWSTLLQALIYAAIGLFLLRKRKVEPLLKREA